MSADNSIDQKITICIDEILDTLGLNGKQALLTHLERNAGLRKDTILEDPELFRKNLGLVLGEHGAEVFEGWIVKRLVSIFKLKQASNLTLAKTICMIRTAEKEPCDNYKEASRDHYVDTNRCKNIRDQYRIKDTPRIRRSSRESDPHAGGRSKE